MSNLNEYRAGTDPTNAASVVRITALGKAGDAVRLRCTTVTNRMVQIQRTAELTQTDWTGITNAVPGTGLPMEQVDADAAASLHRFYRERVAP